MKLKKLKTLLALVAVCLMAFTLQAQQSYFWTKNNIPRLPVFANTAAVTPAPTQAGAMIYSTADATIMIYTGSAWLKYEAFRTTGASGGFASYTVKNGIPYLPFLDPAVYTATGAPSGGIYLASSSISDLRISNGTGWTPPNTLSASAVRAGFTAGKLTNFPGGVAFPMLATAPASLTAADKGAVYINTATNILNVYNGAAWVPLVALCPPFVSGAIIDGNLIALTGLNGSHAYADKSARAEGATQYAYWTSDNANGTGNPNPATPVYSTTNAGWPGTFTSALNKKYLNFSVIPVANDGMLGDMLRTSYQFDNCAPVANSPDMDRPMVGVQPLIPTLIDPPGYSYFDKEENPEGTSIVKWYRGLLQNSPGTATTLLATTSGSAQYSYQYVAGDPVYYLYAEVTPVSSAGNTSDPVNAVKSPVGLQMWPDCAPQADGIILNNFELCYSQSAPIVAGYSFYDREGNAEVPASTVVNIYKVATAATAGTPGTLVSSSASYSYAYNVADAGMYLRAEVTPVAATGTVQGTMSYGAVQIGTNCPPNASGVTISNGLTTPPVVGNTLTAGFTEYDKEGDTLGTPVYQWYTTTDGISKTPIAGQTAATFNSTGYAGVKIMVGVAAMPAAGITNPGAEALSAYVQL